MILAAGTLQSPQLLQLSGIGPAQHLVQLGIPVISDLPGVGQNLREHRMMMVQFRLREPISLNGQFGGWHLGRNLLQYLLTRKGLMATVRTTWWPLCALRRSSPGRMPSWSWRRSHCSPARCRWRSKPLTTCRFSAISCARQARAA